MTENNIDYTRYFEFKTLPKIHGEPDYSQLKELKDKLKTNASKITSDLGGGAHGHLGLVLSQGEYATVSPTPYVRPVHPGVLVIPPGTTNHIATIMREDHKKELQAYHETIDLENALKKQISEAIDEPYLKELRDVTTNTILLNIPTILDYLFTNYGVITEDTLEDEKQNTRNMEFTIATPLTKMYKAVEDLQQLGIAAHTPFSDGQLVQIGIHIIKQTGDFHQALLNWYALPRVNQTWNTFKTHFQNERRALRKVRGPTMQQAGYHQANMLSDEVRAVRNELGTLQTSILENNNVLQQVAMNIGQLPRDHNEMLAQYVTEEAEDIPPQNHANATTNNQNDITTLLRDMQRELNALKSSISNRNSVPTNQNQVQVPIPPQNFPMLFSQQFQPFGGQGRGRGRGGRGGRGGRYNRTNQGRRNTEKYCWTHGACAHSSAECQRPAIGHQPGATFENKMGGSRYYCS